jgi:molybdenum cofactor guanylyltransferase
MKRYKQVSAFILCGGKSSRMGEPKGLLMFCKQPLVLRVAGLVEPLVSAVTVVGLPESYGGLGLHVMEDANFGIPGQNGKTAGPLSGIASALISTRTDWNLILACDLPYLTAAWLNWLLARAVASSCQIVMPRTAGGLEPLAAVYGRECAESIVAALRRGVHQVSDALKQFRIEFVTESDWGPVDPTGRVLYNMNTAEDYEEARRWLEEAGL